MRFTLLSILLLAATGINAQNFEVGVNAGMAVEYHNLGKNEANTNYSAYAIDAIYTRKAWQYGIDLGYRTHVFSGVSTFLDMPIDNGGSVFVTKVPFHMEDREIPLKIFMNRQKSLGKFIVYGGLSMGYCSFHDKATLNWYGKDMSQYYDNNFALVGLQAGATWFATKHIGINAEVAGAYNFTFANVLRGDMSYPLTFGIRYRL